ncbi:FecR family protein [Flavitalea flava]
MTRERFKYLFNLYKTGRLAFEDWEELRLAIQEGSHDEQLRVDFFQLVESDRVHETWSPELEAAMWQQIRRGSSRSDQQKELQQEQLHIPSKDQFPFKDQSGDHSNDLLRIAAFDGGLTISPRRRRLAIRRKLRFAAIAASLLFFVATAWWFSLQHLQNPLAKKTDLHKIQQDSIVTPGTDKAVLILASGERILLDSAGNGQIARQGATKIIKLNGMLSVSGPRGAGKGAASVSSMENHPERQYNTILTPRGGQFEIVLSDGSRVWLNSSSSLRFPTVFSGDKREVELTGEAYFEIEPAVAEGNNARGHGKIPFEVNIAAASGGKGMKIQVLGTSFNAMAYPDEKTINTTLLQGAVIVSDGDLAKRLAPGEQAALNRPGHQLSVSQADTRKAIAWKNELFEFDHTDLASIMRQLARWYDIEVVYRVTPDETELGGSLSKNLNLKEVLELLEGNGINHFKIEGRKVLVLP